MKFDKELILKVKAVVSMEIRILDVEGGTMLEQNPNKAGSVYADIYRNHRAWFMCWFKPDNGDPWRLFTLSPTGEFEEIGGDKISRLKAIMG
jgi:hypothetical protein